MKQNKVLNTLLLLTDKIGVYLLGLSAVLLNISLAFDNVVWGDEAYSQMAIRDTNLYGVYERVYYWDSHPPLYYYYLKFIADIFGYRTPVYHIASIVPFIIGIVLACTLIKKHLGTFPAIFFILISGFSESCVEYNLEIRMYSLVFLFTLLCISYAYLIITTNDKGIYFILMTLFGILAAYTHYYGLALCGLIVFFTGLFNLVKAKRSQKNIKKPLIMWLLSTIIYIVVYIPWLFVLYFQTQAELNAAWMTEPSPFSQVLTFILGGARLKPLLLTFIIIMTIVIINSELKLISFRKGENKGEICIGFHKINLKNWSADFQALLLLYLITIVLLAFGYGASYALHPILAYRYTYVLIPLVLFIFMICFKRFLIYIFPSEDGSLLDDNKNLRSPRYGKLVTVTGSIIMLGMLLAVLVLSLLDFKYFRSLTKTQNVETQKVLDIVGTPNEDAILVSNGVKHLAWSVLPYYYNNDVTTENPNNIAQEPSEFWAFIGYEYDDDIIDEIEAKGYITESYPDLWLGKYAINLYHFYK